MKAKKVLSLLLVVVFCFAVASVAFARYDPCSYCGGRPERTYYRRIQLAGETTRRTCPNNSLYTDRVDVYLVTEQWACRDCGLEIDIFSYREYEYVHDHPEAPIVG